MPDTGWRANGRVPDIRFAAVASILEMLSIVVTTCNRSRGAMSDTPRNRDEVLIQCGSPTPQRMWPPMAP